MVNDHDIEKMLRAIFEREASENPLIAMMRSKFESDLPDLIRRAREELDDDEPDSEYKDILDSLDIADALFGRRSIRIVIHKQWRRRGEECDVAIGEAFVELPPQATLREAILGAAEAIASVVRHNSPIPREGRLRFEFDGRSVIHGGDIPCKRIACEQARLLLGV